MQTHVCPINTMRVPYVRTGYEAVIPLRSNNKFVISAEEDGIITKVTNTEVEVKYKKKGKTTYKLKSWTSKEESEACYTHVMVSNVKVNDKVSKDDTIIYDQAFFEPDIFNPKRVIYKQGDLVTVALMEDVETYEDSCTISKELNKRLGTVVTKVKSIIISADDNILEPKKVGDNLKPEDTLFTIIDSNLPVSGIDEKTLSILKDLKSKSPKVKLKGVISKIEARYNCELEDMSDSLRTFVTNTNKKMKEDLGFVGKVNSGYSVKGIPLLPGQVEIKIYIQVDVGMGIGDKCIIGNQLKCTVGEVFDNTFQAEDGTDVDMTFSYRAVTARIVCAPILNGTTSMVLEKLTEKVVDIYFK